VAVLIVLAAVLLGACDRGPRNERTADSVEEAAMEAVDRLDDIAWRAAHAHPVSVDLAGIAADALAPATIVAVSSLIGHGENTWVAVTHEHAFVLPTDYNRLVVEHPVTVRDSDDAWVLIDLYLRMHEARLGAMGLDPIDTIEEVIGVTGAEAAAYGDEVGEPTIQRRDSSWRARFVTWQHQHGALDRWEVDVDESGRIDAQRDRIADGIGDEAVIE
jgi:hypothetical protein